MVLLTSPTHGTPPQRGTTLPPKLSKEAIVILADGIVSPTKNRTKVGKAHTLPSTSNQLMIAANNIKNNNKNNNKQFDFPIVSRNAPLSVSILSLPSSDNEAINFENG